MQNKMFRRELVLLLLAGLCCAQTALGGGVATSVGVVKLNELQPGEKYSMERLAHFPYSVSNLSQTGEAMDISLYLKTPAVGRTKAGYDPLPDLSWVKIAKTFWAGIPAKGGARTDVEIRIPKDERLRGRAFQFYIEAAASPSKRREVATGRASGGYIDVAVASTFLITIARNKSETAGTVGRAYPIDLKPPEVFFGQVELGTALDGSERGKVFTLTNPGDNKRSLRIGVEVKNAPQAESAIRQGFPDIPDTRYMLLEKSEYFVEAGQTVPVNYTLFFPKRKEFTNKNYMFVLEARTLDAPIPFGMQARLYMSTGEMK